MRPFLDSNNATWGQESFPHTLSEIKRKKIIEFSWLVYVWQIIPVKKKSSDFLFEKQKSFERGRLVSCVDVAGQRLKTTQIFISHTKL